MNPLHATRRNFLLTGTAAAVGLTRRPSFLGSHSLDPQRSDPGTATTLRDPRIAALVARALDAARSAGAQYADVRVTNTRTRAYVGGQKVENTEVLGFGVRVLVQGVWGFAASPYLTEAEASRLGKLAVGEAKAIGRITGGGVKPQGTPQGAPPLDLAAMPVAKGDWTTPIRLDPFEVAEGEILDWFHGISRFAADFGGRAGLERANAIFVDPVPLICTKQERVVGSSEGTYVVQTCYQVDSRLFMRWEERGQVFQIELPGTGFVAAGLEWVYERGKRIRDAIPQLVAEEQQNRRIPIRPLTVGRYDMIFDAQAMASMLGSTFGAATQIDRALGYEANATGTSYLGPNPTTVLGTAVTAPLVTVTGNRSLPEGLATVKWDDEGVAPADFTVIDKGTLVDYQTTREQAMWLAPWYQQQGKPIHSHGCAASPTALDLSVQHTPNLTIQPGAGTETFETLVAGLANGIAITGPVLRMAIDHQCTSGLAMVRAFEVKNGKRVAALGGDIGLLFRTADFWKNITALGGTTSTSVTAMGNSSVKGEPAQRMHYSVNTVPAAIKQMTLIDPSKKA